MKSPKLDQLEAQQIRDRFPFLKDAKLSEGKAHELAAHVGAMLADEKLKFEGVHVALNKVIRVLKANFDVVGDLKNPDIGIPFALKLQRSDKADERYSGQLLRMCLRILETKQINNGQIAQIPLLLAGIVGGYVAEHKTEISKKKRTRQKPEYQEFIERLAKENPTEGYQKIMQRAEGEAFVNSWGGKEAVFQIDEGIETITIPASTVSDWITRAKKQKNEITS